MAFQFQRKKLAYLKYPNIDRERQMEHHINISFIFLVFDLKMAHDISQSISDVATSIRKKKPEDL